MLLFDAHLDLSMNALHWNRDLTQTVAAIREAEAGMEQKGRCVGTVALPDMRAGEVGICVATLIARVSRPGNPLPGYHSPEIAAAVSHGQLAYYRILEAQGEIRLIRDAAGLAEHVARWENSPQRHGDTENDKDERKSGTASSDGRPIGVILSMEGADPILSPDSLGEWWDV